MHGAQAQKSYSERSQNVKKNIIYSIILKAVGVGLTFILLPLTVHYLTEIEYGIWVTLFSVMNWVNMMDMGIGLGLRNKLAEAVTKENVPMIREYISTGFYALTGIGVILLGIFYFTLQFADMQVIFNTDAIESNILYQVTFWTGTFIIVAFVLSLIQQVYYAYQKAAMTGMIAISHSAIMLAVVYILTLQPHHNLLYFVYAFGCAILSSRLIFIFLFFYKHRALIPKLCYTRWKRVKDITGLGIRFFIIQICCIFGYTFSNFLITELVGPEYVRSYDVVVKIISASTMLQQLVTTPLWSAYTDAYVRKDYNWIIKVFKKSIILTAAICLLFAIISFFIDNIIWIWMHIQLEYTPHLVLYIFFYYVLVLFNNACCMVLNGIGNINVQMIAWIVTATLVIPLSCYFVNYKGMTTDGIALAMCLSMIVLVIILPIQLCMLFSKWRKEENGI